MAEQQRQHLDFYSDKVKCLFCGEIDYPTECKIKMIVKENGNIGLSLTWMCSNCEAEATAPLRLIVPSI